MNRGWKISALGLLAAIVGIGLALQRQANQQLRGEAELVREQNHELVALRTERERLTHAQLPASGLEHLRADHAALGRLRDEVDALRARVKAMEQAESKAP